MSNNHWNDEVMRIEAMSDENNTPPDMESWDWRYRAEQAEQQIKALTHEVDKYEALLEHARIAIYQIQQNNKNTTNKVCTLLMLCAEQLELADPVHFYANLDANPLVRKRQMEDRIAARREVIDAVRYLIHEVKEINTKSGH